MRICISTFCDNISTVNMKYDRHIARNVVGIFDNFIVTLKNSLSPYVLVDHVIQIS